MTTADKVPVDIQGDGFKRLFPKLDEVKLNNPLQTEVIVAMCNMAQYAFGAYENPTVSGFTETQTNQAQTQYLNSEALDEVFDGFLKIQLKKATNIPHFWWWLGSKNDPYVTFSVGSTAVRSATLCNNDHPVWNTTLYLPLRKGTVMTEGVDKLKITLFDDDTHKEWSFYKYIANAIDKDDNLGSANLELEKLRQGIVRAFDVVVKNKTKVHFTTQYITLEVARKEMGIEKGGPAWMQTVGKERRDIGLAADCSWVLNLGHLSAAPYAFFNSPTTDTQAWMHVYPHSKTILVSFRGTEKTKLIDVLTDLTFFPTELGKTCGRDYIPTPTAELLDEDIRVHSGFHGAYESIREPLLQAIYAMTEWKEDWNICFTGHSLGGALATLAAFEFRNRRNAKGTGPSIAMMNYGAPRVGNRVFAKIYDECLVHSYRVVDREDLIHLIPPGYIHTAKELLCRSNGEVLVEGIKLSEFNPKVLYTNQAMLEEFEDSGSLEEIFQKHGFELAEVAEKHVSKNYFGIIGGAVAKFFENTPAIQ